MKRTVYPTSAVQQGSELWHQLRRERLTASKMKRVLTPTGALSEQSNGLAYEMALHSIPGFVDALEFTGNKHTDWGNDMEPEARRWWQASNPEACLVEVGFVALRDVAIGCSPDGLIYDGGEIVSGLEIKCPAPQTLTEWALAGMLPPEHAPQVHLSMIVCGCDEWEFVGYYPGLRPSASPPAATPIPQRSRKRPRISPPACPELGLRS